MWVKIVLVTFLVGDEYQFSLQEESVKVTIISYIYTEWNISNKMWAAKFRYVQKQQQKNQNQNKTKQQKEKQLY